MTPREAAAVVRKLRAFAATRDVRDRRKAVRITDEEQEALLVLIQLAEKMTTDGP